ncbi:TetR/AcrR family transcriptional regulator [Nocardia nova]|uniref:TetR/AcrR family transcriptional regulator n=1 Tax=Nocardia nova TaxID=37330 RepID=UPI0037B92EFE
MTSVESAAARRPLRDRLLDAAAVAISEVGVDKLSLRAIARREGVSHQAPGHFFKNKTGVLTALAARVVQQLGDEMRQVRSEATERGAQGKEIVIEIGVCYIRFAISHASLFRLAGNPDLLDHNAPELRRALDETWAVLTQAVCDAQAQGWRRDQPSEVVAMMCWSIVHGIASIHNSRLHPTDLRSQDTIDIMRAVSALM